VTGAGDGHREPVAAGVGPSGDGRGEVADALFERCGSPLADLEAAAQPVLVVAVGSFEPGELGDLRVDGPPSRG
jgi:hypothetical protein